MKSLIIALVTFMACLGAHAASNITQVLEGLPDGGYIMDMGVDENSLFGITDLSGKPVPGSPFTIDPSSIPPTGPATRNETSIKTKDQWSCDAPNERVDWTSWKIAGKMLASWCADDNMVPKKKVLSWIENSSMAYICNYAGRQNCDGNEYWNYMQLIADKCAFTGCGWYLQGSGNKSYGRGVRAGLSDPYYICYNV
ncbi:hypothetical protein PG996_012573 [Apiospora saccharicola]|uniref:Uncharacterized protein n=1 Tax=Apiospora saccharicola TaxID=335842 RepID=A0ABR1U3K2_9PEZI